MNKKAHGYRYYVLTKHYFPTTLYKRVVQFDSTELYNNLVMGSRGRVLDNAFRIRNTTLNKGVIFLYPHSNVISQIRSTKGPHYVAQVIHCQCIVASFNKFKELAANWTLAMKIHL